MDHRVSSLDLVLICVNYNRVSARLGALVNDLISMPPLIQSMKQNHLPGSCHDNGETILARSSSPRLCFPGNSYTSHNIRKRPMVVLLIVGTWNNCRICPINRILGRSIHKTNMTTSSLPFLDSSDPRLKLTVQNRIRNVFVTQLEDVR